MNYLAGYAVVMMVVFLFDRLVSTEANSGWGRALLFGACLGLASLVYDIFFWYVFIFLSSLACKRTFKKMLFSLGVGLAIYLGFQALIRGWLQVEVSQLTEQYLAESYANLLTWPGRSAGDWYALLTGFIRRYFTHLSNAFFFAPILLALGGAFSLRERGKGWEIFCLLVPSLLGVAFLHFTESRIAHLPRLTYTAYPGIYLLAAAVLSGLQNWLKDSGWRRAALALPWTVLIMVIVLNNSDVFGLPQLYYLFYWESGGIFK